MLVAAGSGRSWSPACSAASRSDDARPVRIDAADALRDGDGPSALPADDADRGEGIQHSRINELSPIGAFRCLGLDPDDPVGRRRALSSRGYTVLWVYEPVNDTRWGPEHGEVAQPPEGTVVTWAWLRSPNVVDVRLVDAADPTAVDRYRHDEGTYLPGEQPPFTVGCS